MNSAAGLFPKRSARASSRASRISVLALVVSLIAVRLDAQTTGRLQGAVTDATGALLPGVAIVASSPSLQGLASTVTDARGEFRFASLPPGAYAVRADLSGFKSVIQRGIVVGLDRTVSLAFELTVAPVAETITVANETPVIDRTSSTTGVNVTADLFTRLPTERDIYSIARLAPGTQRDEAGVVFYGSSGAENNYIIDGVNATGILHGTEGKQLNFDFVQEIEVKTGGLPAGYGRMTGGIINVLTRSGGNTFKGDAFGFYEGGGLQSDDRSAALRPQTTTTVTDIDNRWDFGGALGGYLLKDKLWFFAAYNRTNRTDAFTLIRRLGEPGSPPIDSVVSRDTRRDLFAGKLTWTPRSGHTVIGSVFGDPGEVTGPVFAIAGPEVTWRGVSRIGATDIVTRYEGTFGPSSLVRAQYGRHHEKSFIEGPGKDTPRLIDRTVTPNEVSNGFGRHIDQDLGRDVFRVDVTGFTGRHELMIGADYELTASTSANWFGGGGQSISKMRQAASGVTSYRHAYFVDDRAPGYDVANPATWQIAAPLVSEPRSRSYSIFVQDSFSATPRLTLSLGLRYELQDVQNRFHETAFKLDTNWAARVGAMWDVAGNGRSKLFANYGRFFENIPQDINIRALGGEVMCFCNNFSPSATDIRPDAQAPRSSLLGGAGEPIDADLRGEYVDEILGGFEYEVARDLVVGAKLTLRRLGRAIEDLLVDPQTGAFAIVNPGEGTLGRTSYFFDGSSAPTPKASRTNSSFELTARQRFSRNWQFLASYVFSNLEGNHDGIYQNYTNTLDPNFNIAFDQGDFLVNSQGPLTAERKHQFKLDGSYQFQRRLTLGVSTWYFSGLPLNAYGYSPDSINWTYFLVPRGSLGRGPSDWETSFHLSFPLTVAHARLTVMADAFNVFDRQAITQLDERYNLSSDGDACAGVPSGICGSNGGIRHRPGSLDPVGAIPDPRATATNHDYLEKGAAFTQPRSLRLGLRFAF